MKLLNIILLLLMFCCGLGVGYFYPKERSVTCPLGNGKNDPLVAMHLEGKKLTCVYTMEPLKLKRKYTKEMWLD